LESGEDIDPDSYPPDLLPGLDDILDAFWELSTDRQIGMAVGPLPSESIDRWLEKQGYGPDEQDELRFYFREMDDAFRGQGKPPTQVTVAPQAEQKLSFKLFDALWGKGKKKKS
jgi:hypothetical protein